MNFNIGACTLFTSAIILAGCAPPPAPTSLPAPVLEQRVGQVLPGDASASYDSVADTVTLSTGGASIVLPRTGTVGPATLFQDAGPNSTAHYMETASGAGRVIFFASEDSDLGIVGAIASRDGAVTLPAGGSADFNGLYAGRFVRASDKASTSVITGDACLAASFGAAPSIVGSIINRSFFATNIVILSTPLSAGGVFSDAVTGGEVLGETASNGRIAGMFADVGAGEIVGALQLDHTIGGVDYYEVGGFTTVAGACP